MDTPHGGDNNSLPPIEVTLTIAKLSLIKNPPTEPYQMFLYRILKHFFYHSITRAPTEHNERRGQILY